MIRGPRGGVALLLKFKHFSLHFCLTIEILLEFRKENFFYYENYDSVIFSVPDLKMTFDLIL